MFLTVTIQLVNKSGYYRNWNPIAVKFGPEIGVSRHVSSIPEMTSSYINWSINRLTVMLRVRRSHAPANATTHGQWPLTGPNLILDHQHTMNKLQTEILLHICILRDVNVRTQKRVWPAQDRLQAPCDNMMFHCILLFKYKLNVSFEIQWIEIVRAALTGQRNR